MKTIPILAVLWTFITFAWGQEIKLLNDSRIELSWKSEVTELYDIFSSPDLKDWSKMETNGIPGTGGIVTWIDSQTVSAAGAKFYKIMRRLPEGEATVVVSDNPLSSMSAMMLASDATLNIAVQSYDRVHFGDRIAQSPQRIAVKTSTGFVELGYDEQGYPTDIKVQGVTFLISEENGELSVRAAGAQLRREANREAGGPLDDFQFLRKKDFYDKELLSESGVLGAVGPQVAEMLEEFFKSGNQIIEEVIEIGTKGGSLPLSYLNDLREFRDNVAENLETISSRVELSQHLLKGVGELLDKDWTTVLESKLSEQRQEVLSQRESFSTNPAVEPTTWSAQAQWYRPMDWDTQTWWDVVHQFELQFPTSGPFWSATFNNAGFVFSWHNVPMGTQTKAEVIAQMTSIYGAGGVWDLRGPWFMQ